VRPQEGRGRVEPAASVGVVQRKAGLAPRAPAGDEGRRGFARAAVVVTARDGCRAARMSTYPVSNAAGFGGLVSLGPWKPKLMESPRASRQRSGR
jgi:hypothetical protein